MNRDSMKISQPFTMGSLPKLLFICPGSGYECTGPSFDCNSLYLNELMINFVQINIFVKMQFENKYQLYWLGMGEELKGMK